MRKRSKDPLTAACTSFLTPWAKLNGFRKTSSRTYTRERDGTIQQLVVDANGFGGRKRTLFTLFSKYVFDEGPGYWDKAGFRICGGKTWDMSTHAFADNAMQEVVVALDTSEYAKIDRLSSTAGMLELTREYRPDLVESESSQIEAWMAGDKELCESAESVREAMKI